MPTQAVMFAQKVSGSPPPFSPSDISGLQLWFKADGSVYNTGTTQATNGQTVETWVDYSGNGRDATQATSGNRPTFVTGALNSLPVIRFSSGSSTWLGTATASYSTQSFFVVLKVSGGVDSYQGFIFTRTSASFGGNSDSLNGFGTYLFGDGLVNGNSDASGTTGATNIIRISGSAGSASNFDNYNVGATANRGSYYYVTDIQNSASASGTKNFVIGADNANTIRYLTGDLAEIIVYDSSITGTDQTNVETYLKNKYGL